MKYETIRRQVLGAILDAAGMGLIHGTSGNIAVRDFQDNVIAITPSGRPYAGMTAEEIAVVDLEGHWLEGPYQPSSETPMHTRGVPRPARCGGGRAHPRAVLHGHGHGRGGVKALHAAPGGVCPYPDGAF